MGVLKVLVISLGLRDAAPLYFVTVRASVEQWCSCALYIWGRHEWKTVHFQSRQGKKRKACSRLSVLIYLPADGEGTVTLETAEAGCVSPVVQAKQQVTNLWSREGLHERPGRSISYGQKKGGGGGEK